MDGNSVTHNNNNNNNNDDDDDDDDDNNNNRKKTVIVGDSIIENVEGWSPNKRMISQLSVTSILDVIAEVILLFTLVLNSR